MLSECMCLRVIIALTIMSARAAAAAACASLPLNICHDCCARNDIVLLASNESFWALLASNFLLLLLSLLLAREFSSSSSSSGCRWRILSRLDESLFSRPLCSSVVVVVESRSRVVCAQDDDSLLLRMQSLDAIQLLFTFAAAASQCRPSMILCTIITHPTVVCVCLLACSLACLCSLCSAGEPNMFKAARLSSRLKVLALCHQQPASMLSLSVRSR